MRACRALLLELVKWWIGCARPIADSRVGARAGARRLKRLSEGVGKHNVFLFFFLVARH
jgi:hypothetical protein